jgi:hypothetical protein
VRKAFLFSILIANLDFMDKGLLSVAQKLTFSQKFKNSHKNRIRLNMSKNSADFSSLKPLISLIFISLFSGDQKL